MNSSRAVPILAFGAMLLTACNSAGSGPQERIALKMPSGTPQRPEGVPALRVRAAEPPFTRADVATYFTTHSLPKTFGSLSHVVVDNLEFVTSAEVSRRLDGASTGLAAGERVAFATLSGTFVFTGPQSKAAEFRRAYAVFDAATGNLLMVGTLPAESRPQ